MKNRTLYLLFFLIVSVGFSQNLDSLYQVARATKDDSIKLRMFNKIGFGYIFNNTKKAQHILEEGIQLAKKNNFKFSLTELTNTYGIYMDVAGKSDSANYYFEEAYRLSQEYGFKGLEAKCINNLGMFNWNKGHYQEALDFFFQSLKMNELNHDEAGTGNCLNNIGLIYQEMNLNQKALEYHRRALKVREKYNLEQDQIASLNNIGINLKDLNRIDEAISTFKKALELAQRKNNQIEYFRLLDNLANAYHVNGELELALQNYLKALDRPEGFEGDEKGMFSLLNNIAALYNETNAPKLALNYANKGFDLLKKFPEKELVGSELYLTSAESYYMLRDFKNARLHKQQFIVLKDSVFSKQNAESIADLEVKYETEKKERELFIQRAELAEQKLTIQKKNFQLYGLLAFAFILALLGYLFYNQQKLKNKQLRKENELKDALIKIETQNRLQEQRLRISRDLHDNIGAQLTFIISSIDNLKYGFDLKDEKLTTKLDMISQFTSATIYELRDTIWAMNKPEIQLEDLQLRISNFIEKADAASHGVSFEFNNHTATIEKRKFSSVEGMNIYRIIQESINNALKYAEAKRITVHFTSENDHFIFKIADDGKGFNLKTSPTGNGINNMKKRAYDLGATIDLYSSDQGTEIILKMKNG